MKVHHDRQSDHRGSKTRAFLPGSTPYSGTKIMWRRPPNIPERARKCGAPSRYEMLLITDFVAERFLVLERRTVFSHLARIENFDSQNRPFGFYYCHISLAGPLLEDFATISAHRDWRRYDGQPSPSRHCGHGPIFIAQRSVANNPKRACGEASSCRRRSHNHPAPAIAAYSITSSALGNRVGVTVPQASISSAPVSADHSVARH